MKDFQDTDRQYIVNSYNSDPFSVFFFMKRRSHNSIAERTVTHPIRTPRVLFIRSSTSNWPRFNRNWHNSTQRENRNPVSTVRPIFQRLRSVSGSRNPIGIRSSIFSATIRIPLRFPDIALLQDQNGVKSYFHLVLVPRHRTVNVMTVTIQNTNRQE